jgi:hypothetical protein
VQIEANLQPVWLIEAGVYGAEAGPLLAEIRRQGMAAELVPHQALRKGENIAVDGRQLHDGDCVIGYGTYPFARQIQVHRRWLPGAWSTVENLDCTAYFAHFGKFLLNQQYVIMPGVEAIRQRDWLFRILAKDDEIFARPTSCLKLFTGRCIYIDDFVNALAPTRYDPATLIVVATPRNIDREWRLIVAGEIVVAASQYSVQGSKCVAPGCPGPVQEFAMRMLAEVHWRPDPMFMIDICQADGNFWLVEINGFSCSWLYQCDLEVVVREASGFAAAMWERARDQTAPK